MTKRLKKVMCALGASTCILGSSISAYAIGFDVTLPEDPYSYAVRKNDSEQNAYVTGTYFSKMGILYAYSQQCEDHSVVSEKMMISPSDPKDVKRYVRQAKPDVEYEMYSYASVSNINVKGRYTP